MRPILTPARIIKYTKMKLRKEITQIIRTDTKLRRKISEELDVSDSTVYGHAVRYENGTGGVKLLEYPVIKIIMEHTGKTEEEIFEEKKESA